MITLFKEIFGRKNSEWPVTSHLRQPLINFLDSKESLIKQFYASKVSND